MEVKIGSPVFFFPLPGKSPVTDLYGSFPLAMRTLQFLKGGTSNTVQYPCWVVLTNPEYGETNISLPLTVTARRPENSLSWHEVYGLISQPFQMGPALKNAITMKLRIINIKSPQSHFFTKKMVHQVEFVNSAESRILLRLSKWTLYFKYTLWWFECKVKSENQRPTPWCQTVHALPSTNAFHSLMFYFSVALSWQLTKAEMKRPLQLGWFQLMGKLGLQPGTGNPFCYSQSEFIPKEKNKTGDVVGEWGEGTHNSMGWIGENKQLETILHSHLILGDTQWKAGKLFNFEEPAKKKRRGQGRQGMRGEKEGWKTSSSRDGEFLWLYRLR